MYRTLIMSVVIFFFSAYGMNKSIDDALDAEESYYQGNPSRRNSLDAEESYQHSDCSDYDAEESYYCTTASGKQAVLFSRKQVTSRDKNLKSRKSTTLTHGKSYPNGKEESFYAEESYNYQEEAGAPSFQPEDYHQTDRQQSAISRESSQNNFQYSDSGMKEAQKPYQEDEVDWLTHAPRAREAAAYQGGVMAIPSRIAGEGPQYYSKDEFYGKPGTGLYVSKNLRPIGYTVYHTETIQAPPPYVPPVVPHYDPPPIQRRPDGGLYSTSAK